MTLLNGAHTARDRVCQVVIQRQQIDLLHRIRHSLARFHIQKYAESSSPPIGIAIINIANNILTLAGILSLPSPPHPFFRCYGTADRTL